MRVNASARTLDAQIFDARTFDAQIFDARIFDPLLRDPEREVRASFAGIPFAARVISPRYGERIARHYRAVARDGLAAACAAAGVPFDRDGSGDRFGLAIRFERPAEIAVHDAAMTLDPSVRALVGRFGPVVFHNAYVTHAVRESFHRNIFPHLRFHVDRGPTMPNQYSCFTRDPFDAEQRHPRASSTLFIANIVARLELARAKAESIAGGGGAGGAGAGGAGEGDAPERGMRPSYDLFHGVFLRPLLGDIVLEQPWSEPEGTGEIAVVDNRTALHATYHKDGTTKGYRIGARYLT